MAAAPKDAGLKDPALRSHLGGRKAAATPKNFVFRT